MASEFSLQRALRQEHVTDILIGFSPFHSLSMTGRLNSFAENGRPGAENRATASMRMEVDFRQDYEGDQMCPKTTTVAELQSKASCTCEFKAKPSSCTKSRTSRYNRTLCKGSGKAKLKNWSMRPAADSAREPSAPYYVPHEKGRGKGAGKLREGRGP